MKWVRGLIQDGCCRVGIFWDEEKDIKEKLCCYFYFGGLIFSC